MRYAAFFGPNLIVRYFKKQPILSKPLTEAKYRTIAYTVAETIWIHKLPTKVLCDNINATHLIANLVHRDRSKKIVVD